jgi:hypothetical protein
MLTELRVVVLHGAHGGPGTNCRNIAAVRPTVPPPITTTEVDSESHAPDFHNVVH